MELKKCKEGHYYDGSIYQECPTCKELREGGAAFGATEGIFDSSGTVSPSMGATVPPAGGWGGTVQSSGATLPLSGSGATLPITGGAGQRQTEGVTVAVMQAEMGIDPVVGWLVSLNGKEKGRDYRIHSDNNFIGRGEQMDICIRGDETISRVNHAVISYDTRDKLFYFSRGDGRSIVRLNGKAMLTTAELNAYDIIEIGKTQLLFIPLCGERFEWTNNENGHG